MRGLSEPHNEDGNPARGRIQLRNFVVDLGRGEFEEMPDAALCVPGQARVLLDLLSRLPFLMGFHVLIGPRGLCPLLGSIRC